VVGDALISGVWRYLSTGPQFSQHTILIWPLGFAIGCVTYFSLPFEPDGSVGVIVSLAGLAGLVAAGFNRRRMGLALSLLMLAAVLLGAGRAQIRTTTQASPDLVLNADQAVDLDGWIVAIERGTRGRPRLVLEVSEADGGPAGDARVRVLADPGPFAPGDHVRLAAVLTRPGRPVVPGSYDFGFHAYFRRLVATGYAITELQPGEGIAPRGFEPRLAAWRWAIAERIRGHLDGRNGAVAAALLTGDRSALPDSAADSLRAAGLGHMLAISGLHMALVAGGVFVAVRLLGAAMTPWSRRFDAARPAALAALIAALIYLLLSGASIPTQRAFIMTVGVLGAVLFARRAISMHSLALAMSLVLILQPEAVMSAGFQMSFAAVAALIAVHEMVRDRPRRPRAPVDRPGVILPFLGGLSMTSAIAGFATAGFAAFHFHRIASFSLVGNLLAMPVFTLVVMPAGVAVLVLMPFGLEAAPLQVMSWGLDIVFAVSDRVAAAPGALLPVIAPAPALLALYAIGFALSLLGRRALRLVGVSTLALAIALWADTTSPDIFVSEDGVVTARFGEEAWSASSTRRARFDTRVFLERQGEGSRVGPAAMQCDSIGCSGTAGGVRIIVQDQILDWQEDCARGDVLIARQAWPAWLVRQCSALVLDADVLAQHGGALIWVDDGEISRIWHVEDGRRDRPWAG
jgi:competence protein ComEC